MSAINTIHVFLSYSFRPKQQAYTRSQINAVLEEACSIAQEDLRTLGYNVKIEHNYDITEYGGQLNKELVDKLTRADICVVDISDNNPNVFYELGAVHALNKRTILIKSVKEQEAFPVPSDISGSFILTYSDIVEIKGRLASALLKASRDILKGNGHNRLLLSRVVWNFPNVGKSIAVVGPPSMTKTHFSEISNWNFVYLDKLGDKDSIVEISILLGRLYPEIEIERYTSNDFPRSKLDNDLVVVGGPGSQKYPGNAIANVFSSRLSIPVAYDEECEKLIVDGTEIFEGVYEGEVGNSPLVKDFGFFGRFVNPYNPLSRIVMIHGIHTLGVLGAVRCFSNHPAAEKNLTLIHQLLGPDPEFYAIFPVEVMAGTPMVPIITPEMIRKLEAK